MELVKKNLISIIAGAIAILAMVSLYYPLSGWMDGDPEGLRARLDTSKKTYQDLEQTKASSFSWPVVSQGAKGQKLDGFPNRKLIDLAKTLVQQVKQQAEDLQVATADLIDAGRHQILPGFLPKATGTEAFFFKAAYRAAMKQLLTDGLRGTLPPSAAEEQAKIAEITALRAKQAPVIGSTPLVVGGTNNADTKAVHAELIRERADKGLIYYSDDLLKGSLTYEPDMIKDTPPANDRMTAWFAQIGYFIQADVIHTIRALNEESVRDLEPGKQNVRYSAVKHVIRIEVPEEYIGPSGLIKKSTVAGMGGGGGPGGPPNIPGSPMGGGSSAAAAVDPFQVSFTGRVGSNMFDVVHFQVKVIIDTRYISRFMTMLEGTEQSPAEFKRLTAEVAKLSDAERAKLTREQMPHWHAITVLSSQMKSVDARAAAAAGYLYGGGDKEPAPVTVMELELDCEILFFHDLPLFEQPAPAGRPWRMRTVNQWMPLDVRTLLDINDKRGL